MKILNSVAEVRAETARARDSVKVVGLVPTMGALHAGHRSLIAAAASECDFVVVSIFVNPTQFGPSEDLEAYPRTFDADLEMCDAAGAHAVFAPSATEIYGDNPHTTVHLTGLTSTMEGLLRPGHFDGVATIVAKLFSIVGPCRAYFGQKDGQQLRVVQQLVADLNLPIEVVACPTIRDDDGLALSSRNAYLTPDERQRASAIPRVLFEIAAAVADGQTDTAKLREQGLLALNDAGIDGVDYLEVVDSSSLEPLTEVRSPASVFVAVRIGRTRLIDNIVLQSVAADVKHMASQGGKK